MAGMNQTEALNLTFAALAHPVRREMLAKLSQGEATVQELAGPFDMSLPAISKHIKVLERAGLITQGQAAQYRPCTINPAPIEQLVSWAEQYRPIWEARFDRLEAYLQDISEFNDDN